MMRNVHKPSLLGWPVAMVLFACLGFAAQAHETDQFTEPEGRTFADLGPIYSHWFYGAVAKGVESTNAEIKSALNSRNESSLRELQSGPHLAHRVNKSLPWAMDVIEGWDNTSISTEIEDRFPGYVTGYKHPLANVYQHTHFVLDPRQFFRLWLARTVKIYGCFIGTDKIGHFTDNGMNLYKVYEKALAEGKTPDQAMAAAIHTSTDDPLIGEKGMVGYGSAGDYSNGDLTANYTGLLFYINLYEPVPLKYGQHAPMCVRDGPYWRLADYVKPDNDFMEVFIDDHLDEALNPGHFESGMRRPLRASVLERREIILEQYRDEHGNRRARPWFDQKLEWMKTYYGQNYGHYGPYDQLVSIPNTLFPAPDENGNVNARNKYGETPLMIAAANGDAALVRKLLARGGDVNLPLRSDEHYNSDWGSTSLHFAAASGNRDVVQALLAAGANVNVASDHGVTPLHRAVKFAEIAQLLIDHGAKVDVADGQGRTPLHWTADDADDCRGTASLLIARGAKVAARDRDGRTPLHLAADAGRASVAAELLRHGADPNAGDSFATTPLHLAASHRESPAVQTLLGNGARVNLADVFGVTPLHDAARVGSADAVAALLRAGASLSVADAYGHTPQGIAHEMNFPTVTAMLGGTEAGAQTVGARTIPSSYPRQSH